MFVRSLKSVILFDYVPHIFVYVCDYTTPWIKHWQSPALFKKLCQPLYIYIYKLIFLLHSHNHDTYTTIHIYMRKHNQQITTNEDTSFGKCTSHTLFERVVKGLCVRGELETEQTALLSHSARLLNPGSFCPIPQLGACSLYSNLSPTNWTSLWYRVI